MNLAVVDTPTCELSSAKFTAAAPPVARASGFSFPAPFILVALTVFAALVNGYHPYADDAGIYVACVERALHPHLYGSSAVFVTAYAHLSIFSSLLAALIRITHVPLPYVLLGSQLFTTWLVLYSCWQVARKCFSSQEARWSSVSLVAVCLTMPVAGSALFMMDPYVTSRSFSTPLTLLAIGAVLDHRPFKALLWFAAVGLFHPLMAIYVAGFLLLLWMVQEERWLAVSVLCGMSILAGAVIQFSQRNVVESAAYRTAVLTRSYYFLFDWRWYELLGLAAPLLLIALYCWWKTWDFRKPAVALCGACLAIGVSSITVSLLFAHPESHSHLVARIQTIRPFVIVYYVLFLGLGGVLGQYLLKRFAWRWALTFCSVAAIMFAVQWREYSAVPHFEMPWIHSLDGWDQAFVWIRDNTPADAFFALDADYINANGEDTAGFRAMADRGSLADDSKDGGAAAAFPQLAEKWMRERTADTNLSGISDHDRIQRLAPFGVTWLVLEESAKTKFFCPFQNNVVKVCRLPSHQDQ